MIIDDTYKSIVEELPNSLRACIDWLSFTIHADEYQSPIQVMEFLGFRQDQFLRMAKGASGYRSMYLLNGDNIRILFDGNSEMGIHVDVSGSAISALLFAWKKKNTVSTPYKTKATIYRDFEYSLLLDLLDALSEIATFTRIDLAIDDIGCNYYSCNDVINMIENQQLVSKFKNYQHVCSSSLCDAARQGQTIYLGSRQSEIMVRIYDKKLEFFSRHNVTCPYEWVRWEMELKKDRANQAVKQLLETHSLSTVCIGILSHYLRFIVPDNSVRSRCSNDTVWDCFINDIKGISLYVPDSQKTIEDTKRWLNKYVGASLSAVIESDGGSLDFIYDNLQKWQCKRQRNRNLTNRLMNETQKWEKEQ